MHRIVAATRNILDRLRWLSAFVAFNIPLVFLLLSRNFSGVEFTPGSACYLVGAVLGWYLFPLLLVGSVLCLILPPRYRAAGAVCIILFSGFLFYLLVDGFVFPVTHFHLDYFWLDYLVHDFHGLGLPSAMLFGGLAALGVILALEYYLFSLAGRVRRRSLVSAGLPLLVLAGLLGSQATHIIAYEQDIDSITRLTPLLPFYLPLHSHREGQKWSRFFTGSERETAAATASSFQGNFQYPLAPVKLDSTLTTLPNIVVIFLESWRADTMDQEVTPHIADLATRSTVMGHHFSTGNSTVAGVFGFFYGIQPTYWEAVKANSTSIDNPVLIDVLAQRGYGLGVFANSGFERHKIADTVFRGLKIREKFHGRDDSLRDVDMTDRMLSWVAEKQETGRPFFLFGFYKASHFDYNYDQAHHKFKPSRNLATALVGKREDPQLYYNDYRNAVYFDDDQVGRLLDQFQASGLMENTIIIITSDHAEEFDDNGADYWGHGSNFTRFQTEVPMVMYLPDRPATRIDDRTSHLDMAATLLKEYLGVNNQVADFSDGVDLLTGSPPERPLVIASYYNHAFVVGADVYAVEPTTLNKYRLDDITSPAEPLPVERLQDLLGSLGRFYK